MGQREGKFAESEDGVPRVMRKRSTWSSLASGKGRSARRRSASSREMDDNAAKQDEFSFESDEETDMHSGSGNHAEASQNEETKADAMDEKDFMQSVRKHLRRLIAYAQSADVCLQQEAAELLANEAVQPARQRLIVQHGGLELLLPLTESTDNEVRRLAAHALANLSVDTENQITLAREGGIEMVLSLLRSRAETNATLRQAAKALANLAVNPENKTLIAEKGGIPPLVRAFRESEEAVQVEAAAALANLAVDDNNERVIGATNIFSNLVSALSSPNDDLAQQAGRALRNLSVDPANKAIMRGAGAEDALLDAIDVITCDVLRAQCERVLANLQHHK